MPIEVKWNEYGAAFAEATFAEGPNAGIRIPVYIDNLKLSLLQAGFVSIDPTVRDDLGLELPDLELERDEMRLIGPAVLRGFTTDPAILAAALELWDAVTYPGASRIDWYTGEPL